MICARCSSQAAFCATRLLYHICFDLSRGFWKVFKKFFVVLSNRFLNFSAEALDYYITSLFICQEVFEKFFKNFCDFFEILCFRKATRLLYHISFHLSRGFPKVFFNFFCDFSSCCFPTRRIHTAAFFAPLVCASRWQPAYYSTSSSNCQGVFFKFFHFGTLGALS